jgi:hypothetical protein
LIANVFGGVRSCVSRGGIGLVLIKAVAMFGLRAFIRPNPRPFPALPPPAGFISSSCRYKLSHEADRCICISQNFKDRRALADHSD